MKMKCLGVAGMILLLAAGKAGATIDFNDGGYHLIDYLIDDTGGVFVDYDTPNAGTQIEVVSGGWIQSGVNAWERSRLTISGGEVGWIETHDSSEVIMYSGLAANIGAENRVEIYGGEITGRLTTVGNASGIISGGSIGRINVSQNSGSIIMSGGHILDSIVATENGLLELAGMDFMVNGHSVGYGDRASTWATPWIDQWGNALLIGTVSGTLESGDSINNSFTFDDNGDITFIPEPGTIVLLLVGAAILRNRNRN